MNGVQMSLTLVFMAWMHRGGDSQMEDLNSPRFIILVNTRLTVLQATMSQSLSTSSRDPLDAMEAPWIMNKVEE